MLKTFVFLGSINAFLSVALGAFGAHALKQRLSVDMLTIYQTGVQYQMIHAIGLLLIGVIGDRLGNSSLVGTSGWLIFTGIIIFSGSLYALSLSGIRVLGAITPIGGLSFLLGWAILAYAVLKAA